MSPGSNCRRALLRTSLVVLLLAPLHVAFAFGQDSGGGHAMSPVGAWHFQILDNAGNEAFTAYVVFHPDGTSLNTPSVATDLVAYGTWEKIDDHDYTMSFYFALIDDATGEQTGNLKIVQPFTLDDKDNMHGEAESFILLGTDPIDPNAVIPLPGVQRFIGKRLPAA